MPLPRFLPRTQACAAADETAGGCVSRTTLTAQGTAIVDFPREPAVNPNPSDPRGELGAFGSAAPESPGRERETAAGTPSRWKWLVRAAKLLVAIAVIVGLGFAAKESLSQWRAGTERLRSQVAEVDRALARSDDSQRRAALHSRREQLIASMPTVANLDWNRIAAASVLYGLALVPPGLLLRQAVCSFDQRCRISTAVAAQLLGHVGKYVPGKAMVVVLRVGALSADRVQRIPATVSVFMETLLMMAVGAAVGGLVICWLPVPGWMLAGAAAVAGAATVPTLPPVLRLAARYVTKVQAETPERSGWRAGWRVFFAGWFYSLLAWVLIGAAFTLLLQAIPSPDPLPTSLALYPVAVAAIALGMVAGFASLLPGGAGVRELVLTAVLAPAVGVAHGLLAAIAARLMFMGVEVVLAGAAWLWLRWLAPGRPDRS